MRRLKIPTGAYGQPCTSCGRLTIVKPDGNIVRSCTATCRRLRRQRRLVKGGSR